MFHKQLASHQPIPSQCRFVTADLAHPGSEPLASFGCKIQPCP